ncbi:MAG: ABC transporter permease [Acidobacteriia bacterium]|nr:ABC transporter permease [Terriglobia bacterium]
MRVLLHVIVKELLQLRRDRKMIPAMVVGPIMQLLALGYAANMDVKEIPLLLVDQDRTYSSRALLDRFEGSGYFRLVGSEDEPGAIEPWLVRGRAQVALVIGAGYGDAVAAGRPPKVQVIADGSDANSAVVGLGYASRIVAAAGARMVGSRLEAGGRVRAMAATGSIEMVPRVWYNPDLTTRWFYVPAILAMTLMLITMILPSVAVVREKEIGTLEQLSVTPVRPWQMILGKLFPFAAIGMVDLVLVTALVVLLFRVPLRGSFPLLALLTVPFLMTTLGLGLLVSAVVRTQQQAMMTSAFVFMVPMILLSGLIFPIENMPVAIQWGTLVIPLRYYNNIIRGIFLKGSGIDVLWPEGAILTGIGVLVLATASLRFRKSLD